MGPPAKLYTQFCFHDLEYLIDLAVYDSFHSVLALAFTRPDHEKVILLDATPGRKRTIYSSTRPGETIVNMYFNEDGSWLLITTQYKCYGCDLGSGKLATVTKAGPNERLTAGNYRGEEVAVAVVEHSGQEEPSVKPRCTYYRRGADGVCLRFWYYLMPELDEKQFRYFLYATGGLGFGSSNDEKGFQQYWVTKGFFLERPPKLDRCFKPKCYTYLGNRRVKLYKEFQALHEIFVWHKAVITSRYSVGNSGRNRI